MLPINMLFRCEICRTFSKLQCESCKATYYCSVEHQKMHWDDHKLRCGSNKRVYIERRLDEFGINRRVLLSRLDVKKGEIMFTENLMLRGPDENLKTPQEIIEEGKTSSCIVCYRILETQPLQNGKYASMHCPWCLWSICSQDCQEYHGKLECKILKAWALPPKHLFTPHVPAWKFILIIRALLYKRCNPVGYKTLMELDINPQMENHYNKQTTISEPSLSNDTIFPGGIATERQIIVRDFIRLLKYYRVEKFLKQEKWIDHIIQVVTWNSVKLGCSRTSVCNGIFQLTPAAVQSCMPNALSTITFDYKLVCMASQDILCGEEIRISKDSAHILHDNYSRITWLNRQLIPCNCTRCTEIMPSELGSYHSALKCSDFKLGSTPGCKIGDLLPYQNIYTDENNTTRKVWHWKCDLCKIERTEEIIGQLIISILHKMKSIETFKVVLTKKILRKYSNDISLIKLKGGDSIIHFLKEHENVLLNSNHSLIFKMKLQLLEWISEGIHEIFSFNKQERYKSQIFEAAVQIFKFTEPLLNLLEIVHPGISIYSARLNYLKQQAFVLLSPEILSSRMQTIEEKTEFSRKLQAMIAIRKDLKIVFNHFLSYHPQMMKKMLGWVENDRVLYKILRKQLAYMHDTKKLIDKQLIADDNK